MPKFRFTRFMALLGVLALCGPPAALAQPATPATAACSTGPIGQLVVAPAGSVSGPSSPGLIVLDAATGKQVRSIQIPLVTEVFTTNLPDHVIARAGPDLFVVDIGAGDAIRLSFGDVKASELLPNELQTRGTAGKRFFLLGDGAMANAFAVDLMTGVATDLVKLVATVPGASKYAGYVAVSPNDAHIVIWDGGHTYLASTSDLATVKRIGGSGFTYGPTFSHEGSDLIYSRSLADNAGSELVVQPLDGSPERVIQSSKRVAITLAIPGQDALLVDDRSQTSPGGDLSLLDIATEETRTLLDYSGSVLSVQFTPDGAKAIAGVDDPNGRTWTLIDLATGESRAVSGAAESSALPGLYGNSNWATFTPIDLMGVGTAGDFYGGMSLQTGAFHKFFDAKKNATYATPQLSASGRWALLQATTKPESQAWLLDNETGKAKLIASALAITVQFSPDECWLALSKSANVDGLRTTVLSLAPTSGDAVEIPLGNGRVLAWLS